MGLSSGIYCLQFLFTSRVEQRVPTGRKACDKYQHRAYVIYFTLRLDTYQRKVRN